MKAFLLLFVWSYGNFDVEVVEFETMEQCVISGENIHNIYEDDVTIKWTCQAK